MKKLLYITVMTAIVVTLTSCTTEIVKKDSKLQKGAFDNERWKYAPIKGYKIALEPITSRRSFFAGDNVSFVFRLKNNGRKVLHVPEWRLNEAENLKIYYAPYSKKLKSFKDPAWKCCKPEWTYKRSTLVLNPGNSVLVDKNLSFLKDIKSSQLGKNGKYYYIYATLNLKSIKCRSKAIKIKVR